MRSVKRVIDVSDTLYKTCKRLVSEGDPRPSESCIADSEPREFSLKCLTLFKMCVWFARTIARTAVEK